MAEIEIITYLKELENTLLKRYKFNVEISRE
jgi:hypothetical protein